MEERTCPGGKFSVRAASEKLEIRRDSYAFLPCRAKNFLTAPCTFPIGTASKSKPAAPIDGAARRYEALIPHAASGIRRRYAFEYTAGSQAPFPIFCAV